jgi:anthranilate phosphoribosyltransferase
MRFLVIDNYDSFTFNLVQLIGSLAGTRPQVVKNDELGPREVEAREPAGVILSPGPGHPRDAGRMIEILKELSPEIPILGVCLGHQAIVEAFGGKVSGAGEIVHGKASEVRHEGGPLFEGVPSPFAAARYHSLAAERASLPEMLRETARTASGIVMAIEHRERPVYGVQFHPESVATAPGRRILANFVGVCAKRRQVDATKLALPGPTLAGDSFAALLERLLAGADLGRDEARALGDRLLKGELTPAQTGAFVAALRAKGERVDEVAGLALALRDAMTRVKTQRRVVDLCGTGGDARGTFNISTAAAFVVAGAGVAVAKHGNRAVSSRAGSADLIEALGIPLELEPDEAARALDEIDFAFLYAPRYHAALRHVAPARKELGIRSVFNLLGPLVNPASARRQLLGVFSDRARDLVAHVLRALGSERALVVHAEDGTDELTTCVPVRTSELLEDGRIVERTIDPTELGIERALPQELAGGDATQNAKIVLSVLEGEKGPRRDVVALNAAAALLVAGVVPDLRAGLARAFESLDSGAARKVVERARALRKVRPPSSGS